MADFNALSRFCKSAPDAAEAGPRAELAARVEVGSNPLREGKRKQRRKKEEEKEENTCGLGLLLAERKHTSLEN